MAKPGGKWQFLKEKGFKRMPLEATQMEKLDAILQTPIGEVWDEAKLGKLNSDPEWAIALCSDWELAKIYQEARRELDELSERVKALTLMEDAYTKAFIDRFEEAGEYGKTFKDGMSLGATVEPYPSVENQAELYTWIKSTNQEALLTLNWQTMASIVKDCLTAGKEIPPGIKVFYKDKLTCRGRQKGGGTEPAQSSEVF